MFEGSKELNDMAMAVLRGEPTPDNPCYRDETGKPRIRYNGMMVEIYDGKIVMYYTWNDTPMLRAEMQAIAGQTVVITGAEGSMGLDLVS